jgi:hypothetical protein
MVAMVSVVRGAFIGDFIVDHVRNSFAAIHSKGSDRERRSESAITSKETSHKKSHDTFAGFFTGTAKLEIVLHQDSSEMWAGYSNRIALPGKLARMNRWEIPHWIEHGICPTPPSPAMSSTVAVSSRALTSSYLYSILAQYKNLNPLFPTLTKC